MTDVGEQETLPKLNLELLRDLVFWAEGDHSKFKDEWNQSVYAYQMRNGVCRTAFCIAGQAVVQAGFEINWNEDNAIATGNYRHIYSSTVTTGEDIEDLARDLIGLSLDESYALFDGDNDIDDLYSIAHGICERRGLTF